MRHPLHLHSSPALTPRTVLAIAALAGLLAAPGCPGAEDGERIELGGLQDVVRVVVDRFGVPHIIARNDADLVRVQGYVHARDRLWQMDLTRREVGGTLAELLGPDAISGDIQNRTIGLRRAAERSLDAASERERTLLEVYAEGVNAWIAEAESTGQLPPQYAELELSSVRPWDAVDSLAIGKGVAASLSLSIDAGRMEELEAFIAAGDAGGFDGAALFSQVARRVAPIDAASTLPDATGGTPFLSAALDPPAGEALAVRARLAKEARERLGASRLLTAAMERDERTIGSNEWGVAASHSSTGHPIVANDPHLSLNIPSTFYQNHLIVRDDPVEGRMNVAGITFPGIPFVILGQNERIAWGATTNPMDVTDIFADRAVGIDQECPENGAVFWIVSEGDCHPVQAEFATYRANDPSDGAVRGHDEVPQASVPLEQSVILTAPFRSFGPLVAIDDPNIVLRRTGETTALFLQYTGFHATRELATFRKWARARNLDEFREGLRDFDFGSQNWIYGDAEGNLAYFSSAENPLRRDLENGEVVGLPPFFVRDGSGPNNWVPDPDRSQGQTIPFAVLPEDEMPHVINPPNGFFVNANNDPAGVSLDNDPLNQHRPSKPEAIYYLNPSYDEGLRAGRITRLIQDELDRAGSISPEAMRRFQSNTQQLDAELLTPFLVAAWRNAGRDDAPPALAASRADADLAEAMGRLEAWDFSTPTGIPEGWDHTDVNGERLAVVPEAERRAAVAATIYNVWRAEAIKSIVDARLAGLGAPGVGSTDALKALHHLLVEFSGHGGEPVANADFFPEPQDLSRPDRRDLALLEALRSALDRLASDAFAPAFANSTDQDDYLWGQLHRITFDAELPQFSVPPQNGFEDLAPDLPGLSRDGGFEVVNASGFSARADDADDFRFGGGPVRRYVGVPGAGVSPAARVEGREVIPGGSSGIPGDPLYAIQLPTWLTADSHPVVMFETQAERDALRVERFVP